MRRRDVLTMLAGAVSLRAQREAGYDASVVKQTRIDMRDLGYPPEDVIPSDECAIRALAVAPDGVLYGATSGTRSHLFTLSPVHGYVQPLGVLPDVTTVYHSLAISASGDVYAGGSIGVDNNAAGYDRYAGGHLFKYARRANERGGIRIGRPLDVEDLGIPVASEGVYNLAIDRDRGMLYGTSYPGGHFFSYSIADKRTLQHGALAQRRIPGEKFENERAIGRALAIDGEGDVFTSGEGGHFYRFSAKSQKLEALDALLPGVPGRQVYSRVDAWAAGTGGVLYGGTSDGYLFRLDTQKLRVENLGKPLNQYRIRGLAFAGNGRLYGVGGDDDEMARLFSLDPSRGVYELLGMVDVNRRPYYSWQAYVIDSVIAGLDGTIYLGQAERKSKLYLYYPV
jgi:hypothetical protein